jgi:hypothetical protein
MKRRTRWAAVLLGIVLVCSAAVAFAADPADDTRYLRTSLRGALTDPATKTPMAGATIRLVSQAPDGATYDATTGPNGEFAFEQLPYGDYAVEIETAQGEKIYGVNAFEINKARIQVQMKVSERIDSSTAVANVPTRFVATVKKEPANWKRFWRELAIFLGVSAGLGAAAL